MLKRLRFAALAGLTLVLALQGQFDEYHVKAAFLYNFAKFVEWPPQTFKTPQDPIVIGVLGPSSLRKTLEEAVSGKAVEGRKFAVRELEDGALRCDCQILFVASSERRRFRSMAGGLRGTAILTVGETPGFAAEGGVINFKFEGDRLRFEINVDAAEQEGLRISSKLLSLSQVVRK
ncbi:MAG: YfiR family protein [Acidobacteriia bacterium]|nr:YfiR family protein [Terriglobia bacterium]